MSSSVTKAPYYFVPAPTRHPIVTSIGLLGFGSGASMWVNGSTLGMVLCLAGVIWTIASLYVWFGEAIGEADKLCALMDKENAVWGCLSDDMDMFIYGCKKVLRCLEVRFFIKMRYFESFG